MGKNKSIKPYLSPGDVGRMPSKDAKLVSQSVDWEPDAPVVCTQTYLEADGIEYTLEMNLDPCMTKGLVISCNVCNPGIMGSGTWSNQGPAGIVSASGVIMAPRHKDPTQSLDVEDMPTLHTEDKVEGMDYDFSDTGLMNRDKKLK